MDSGAYKAEIAQVVAEVARQDLIPRLINDPGRHRRMVDLADIREARVAVHALCVIPDRYLRPLWAQLRALDPELGVCVMHVRKIAGAESLIERGEVILEELRQRAGQDAGKDNVASR